MSDMNDLHNRLVGVEISLGILLDDAVIGTAEWHRLAGKIEGVKLAREMVPKELRRHQ